MYIETIITTNFIPFVALAIMICFVAYNPLFERRQTQLFFTAFVVNIVVLVAISLDYRYSILNHQGMWAYRRITSFINFAASPIILFLLVRIFEKERLRFVQTIPILINVALSFVSIFHKTIFFISTDNEYFRGPLFFVPFMLATFYIGTLAFRKSKERVESRAIERLFLMFVSAFLAFCMYLEIVHYYHFLTWCGTAASLILYYLLLTIYSLVVDNLTGAYNRIAYSKKLEISRHKASMLIAIIDLNNFKYINDAYGHDKGDECLKRFVHTLNKKLYMGTTLYRVGGDEFAVISTKMGVAELENIFSITETELGDFTFSYGIVKYAPDDNLEDVLKQGDSLMYAHKKSRQMPPIAM